MMLKLMNILNNDKKKIKMERWSLMIVENFCYEISGCAMKTRKVKVWRLILMFPAIMKCLQSKSHYIRRSVSITKKKKFAAITHNAVSADSWVDIARLPECESGVWVAINHLHGSCIFFLFNKPPKSSYILESFIAKSFVNVWALHASAYDCENARRNTFEEWGNFKSISMVRTECFMVDSMFVMV